MPHRPIWRVLTLSCVLAAVSLYGGEPGTALWTDDDPLVALRDEICATIQPLDAKGFQRKTAAKPSEWLWMNREPPQTSQAYKNANRVRATEKRKIIVIQPLGEMDAEHTKLIENLREYAEIFFQAPARIEKPLPLGSGKPDDPLVRLKPAGHRFGRWGKQYDADKILTTILAPKLPDDALVCLGITMEDLFDGDLNYVFGLGSLRERVGVYSMCRYYPEFWGKARQPGDEIQALRRSCKVLNHESGHMFGLTHCVFYECSMNGSNSLQESDSRPIHFCPICHEKILATLKFDPLKRFEQLEQFYAKNKLTAEAAWMKQRLANYKAMLELKKQTAKDE